MIFEWDAKKNKENNQKHGVWFEEAEQVFEDDFARVFFDEEHSAEEDRFIIIGRSVSRLLIVVHCFREDESVIRIISARKTTKRERIDYEEGI